MGTHQLKVMSRAVEGYEEANLVIKEQGIFISVLMKFLITFHVYLLTGDKTNCCIVNEIKICIIYYGQFSIHIYPGNILMVL